MRQNTTPTVWIFSRRRTALTLRMRIVIRISFSRCRSTDSARRTGHVLLNKLGEYESVKRALITGISGQDGSYLAEIFLANEYEIHGIICGRVRDEENHLPLAPVK